MKWIYLVHVIVFMAGAAVSGAAPNMAAVIIGRIIMGIGAAVVYQWFVCMSLVLSCINQST